MGIFLFNTYKLKIIAVKNRNMFGLLLLTMIFLFGFIEEEKNPLLKIGQEAPMTDYKMRDVSGSHVTLNDVKNENGLLVIFSCNTCPFVLKWEDRYPLLSKQCKAGKIGMIAINSNEARRDGDDSMEKMKTHATDKGYDFFYTVDVKSKLAYAFGARHTPEIFLFDKDLKLTYTGSIDDNLKNASEVEKHYLEDAIKNQINGKPIVPNKTKAIGCSIKKVKT